MSALLSKIRQDLGDFGSLSPQIRFLLLFQLVILFVISLLIGLLFSPGFGGQKVVHKTQSSKGRLQNYATLASSQTLVSITPSDVVLKIGETQTFSVVIEGQTVPTADIVIVYDPKTFIITDVKKADIFDRVIVNEVKPGEIHYSASFSPDTTAQQGTMFTFAARAIKKTQETKIVIDKKQSITARVGENTLGATKDAIVRVFD